MRNTLNGNTVINGAGTFSTGTGNVGLNGNVLIADSFLGTKVTEGKWGVEGDAEGGRNAV